MFKLELNRDNLTFIGLVIVVLLLLGQCNRSANLKKQLEETKIELQNSNSNFKASQDTVRVIKNKKGYLEADITTFKVTNKELLDANKKLASQYAEALSLNRKLKNVNTLLTAELKDKDSVIVYQKIGIDSTFRFEDFQDYGDSSYRRISFDGKIKDSSVYGKLMLDQNIKLWMAIENNKGVNSLKLSTKYPFDNFDIQGIELVNRELNTYKKKSRWVVSTGVGLGFFPSSTTVITVAPMVGIMVGWSPKWLQF